MYLDMKNEPIMSNSSMIGSSHPCIVFLGFLGFVISLLEFSVVSVVEEFVVLGGEGFVVSLLGVFGGEGVVVSLLGPVSVFRGEGFVVSLLGPVSVFSSAITS